MISTQKNRCGASECDCSWCWSAFEEKVKIEFDKLMIKEAKKRNMIIKVMKRSGYTQKVMMQEVQTRRVVPSSANS